MGRWMACLAALALAGGIASCGGPSVEGAWEGRIDHPQGSDPSGIEVHITITRFLTEEPCGAFEYTVFHPTGEMDACAGTLVCDSKEGGVFVYREKVKEGPCADDMLVKVTPAGEAGVKYERVAADGTADVTGTLKVQTGIKTAKD